MNEDDLSHRLERVAFGAKLAEAEKLFFNKHQPFYPLGFSVSHRGPGHWDIIARQCPGQTEAVLAVDPAAQITRSRDERAFRIRGEPGNVVVFDERWDPSRGPDDGRKMTFRSVSMAMLWIVEELMQEPAQ